MSLLIAFALARLAPQMAPIKRGNAEQLWQQACGFSPRGFLDHGDVYTPREGCLFTTFATGMAAIYIEFPKRRYWILLTKWWRNCGSIRITRTFTRMPALLSKNGPIAQTHLCRIQKAYWRRSGGLTWLTMGKKI